MATTSQAAVMQPTDRGMTRPVMLVALWQALLGVGLVFGAIQVWNLPEFFNLGDVVQRFLALVIFLAALAAFSSAFLIWQINNNGRFIALIMNFSFFALAILMLGQVLGLYQGLDQLAEGLWRNALWLLGFPIGYALVWVGWRFREGEAAREWLVKAGLGVMMVTVAILLLLSGLPTSIIDLFRALFQPVPLLVLGLLIGFFLVGRFLSRDGARFGETIPQRESWQGWLFLLPNFVNFSLFFAIPLLLSLYLSFTDYNAISRPEWVGFENYISLVQLEFHTIPADQASGTVLPQGYGEIASIGLGANRLLVGARDPMFWISLGNTFRYCFMLLILGVVPALLLALLLNSKVPGMKIYRAIFFLPSIAAVVGVALIWQWLYDPIIGFINYAIRFFFPDSSINWLSDPNVMLVAVVIMAAWQVLGFNAVIFLAGLQGIPKEVMEASTVDGAGPVTRFFRIMMPLIAPTTFFVVVTTLIAGLQAFSEMYVLLWATSDNARLTTVYYLYEEGFERFNFGNASATAWLLFIVIFVVTLVQFRLSSRSSAYQD
jgi:ABC-type sugar transport system permease subunit